MNGLALCAGVGGLELGLHLALGDAYRTVCFVERDAYAASVLVARMADQAMDRAPVDDDLTSFDGRPWRGLVDIVSAGYPCQPFSVAGKRRGTDDPRHLWPHVARLVAEVQPSLCFFENVPGHLRLGYQEVRGELRRLGFRVAEGLFTAAEVGAPHLRQRLFILGYAEHAGQSATEIRQRFAEGSDGGTAGAKSSGQSPRPSEQSASLADARLLRQTERKVQTTRFEQCGQDVALTEQPGREGFAGDGDHRDEPGREPTAAERPTGAGGASMADATGQRQSAWPGCKQFAAANVRPSGEHELGGSGWWIVEPAVGRVADGVAARVDRLRCCGNGVVPLQAAYAFCTLWAALSGEPIMEA